MVMQGTHTVLCNNASGVVPTRPTFPDRVPLLIEIVELE
jgi:hypothetical protein